MGGKRLAGKLEMTEWCEMTKRDKMTDWNEWIAVIAKYWIPALTPIQTLQLKRTFSRRAGLAGMTNYDTVPKAFKRGL